MSKKGFPVGPSLLDMVTDSRFLLTEASHSSAGSSAQRMASEPQPSTYQPSLGASVAVGSMSCSHDQNLETISASNVISTSLLPLLEGTDVYGRLCPEPSPALLKQPSSCMWSTADVEASSHTTLSKKLTVHNWGRSRTQLGDGTKAC